MREIIVRNICVVYFDIQRHVLINTDIGKQNIKNTMLVLAQSDNNRYYIAKETRTEEDTTNIYNHSVMSWICTKECFVV
jgi:hypothetical protein